MIALVLAAVVGLGVAIRPTLRADRANEWADLSQWHLLHGPTAGCPECESK